MPEHDRLEREIEEILDKIEEFPDSESRAKRARKRAAARASLPVSHWRQALAHQASRINVSQLMLLSFLLILFAFFFRGRLLPGALSTWILYAGVILFVSAFAVSIFGRRRAPARTQQRWRGRTIEYRTRPSTADRLRRWFGGRTRR